MPPQRLCWSNRTSAAFGVAFDSCAWCAESGPSLALRRYHLTMYRVTVMLLMTLAVVAAGVAAYWVASVALEWL
jgi:hypothetical protein